MTEDPEIAAMTAISKALESIPADDVDARARVLQWACARYRVACAAPSGRESPVHQGTLSAGATARVESQSDWASLADLYHDSSPNTDVDRALVAGYWLGAGRGRGEFTGFDANKELKNLGHPIGNITDAMQSLIDRRPALVMQTAKSGAARQARKKYKLTEAGVAAVVEMTTKQA